MNHYNNDLYVKTIKNISIILIVISILGFIFSINDIFYLNNILSEKLVKESEHEFFKNKNLYEYWISTIGHIIYGILFLIWFYRSYKNVYISTNNQTPCKPGLVPFSFLIPIFNLYGPYQIMKFTWQENNLLIEHETKNKGYRLIKIWWTFSLLTLFYSRICSRKYNNSEYADEYLTATYYYMVYYILNITFFIISIKLINRINKAEINKLK